MKKSSFLALAAVGLFTAACSSSDVVSDVQNPVTLDGKGQGFLSVNLNLPTKPVVSTRVDNDGYGDWDENNRLEDGTPNEYKVNDVTLLIFGGDKEEEATLQQFWSPTNPDWANTANVNDDPNQVTTRKKYVVKLDEGVSGPYWILAVVNSHGIIKLSTEGDKLTVNGTDYDFESCTLATLQNTISANDDGTTPFMNNTEAKDGFFMTNAVFSNQQGGHTDDKAKALILAPVASIYESESAAEAATAAPSADIYVERGLAKVTVSANNIAFDASIKPASGSTLEDPSLSGWVLDNTNKSSFIVRKALTNEGGEWGYYSRAYNNITEKNIAGIDIFRFVGNNNVDVPAPATDNNDNTTGESSATTTPVYTQSTYRTYWSPDPNYTDAYNAANFYEPKAKTFPAKTGDPQYCFENTFDVDHQSYKNTTRVIAKVSLNKGKTFYTLGSDRKTLYQLEDVKNTFVARIMNDEDFKTWATTNITGSVTADNFGDLVLSKKDVSESNVKDIDKVAGIIHVSDIQIKKSSTETVNLTGITKGTDILNSAINNIGKIQQYPQGETYYAIRIKHFGDDLTPWGWNGEKEPDAEDDTDQKKINKIYPVGDVTKGSAAENYLGRYGVLRNNWYELSLDKILKIGHPIVPWLNPENGPDPTDPDKPDNPENPDHPDDSLDDSYISARINILSWATRPQGVTLK